MKNNKTNKVMISKSLLNFLKVCFWINLMTIPLTIVFALIYQTESFFSSKNLSFETNSLVSALLFLANIPFLSLLFYSFYFYFKYDRYSKSGIYLFIFNWVYAQIYFYNVVWKRKRELINSFEHEQVIGNKIFIETEEEDYFDFKTKKL